ncbi:MAG TPA: hypothetical protein DHW82_14215 [Spirochaetia bacterium]|nr:MAG: hypothetical protein A2Y41_00355 [Spirochaetes bacterium GWB1_36_13]HCL58145.1 hypothetical protein [Spirochaetia bacterium]
MTVFLIVVVVFIGVVLLVRQLIKKGVESGVLKKEKIIETLAKHQEDELNKMIEEKAKQLRKRNEEALKKNKVKKLSDLNMDEIRKEGM